MRTHTGEKPYQCTYCDAAFAQGNDLKAHVRRHTGERFQCELCTETFLMGYLLTQHKRTVHGKVLLGRRGKTCYHLRSVELCYNTFCKKMMCMVRTTQQVVYDSL